MLSGCQSRSLASSRVSVAAVSVAALSLAALGCGDAGTRARVSDMPVVSGDGELAPSPSAPTIDANGDLLLDDLADADSLFTSEGISGEWFTYSDGTGELVPPDHTGLPSTDGEAHVTGQGFTDWGAGVSAYLRSADLSRFESVVIRARGAGALVVELATPATSPPGEGGTCMGGGCFGHFAATIQLSEQYQDFELPFATLMQPTWAQPAELSLDGVISVNLVAKVVGGSASIDLWLDRLVLHAAGGS